MHKLLNLTVGKIRSQRFNSMALRIGFILKTALFLV